VADELIVRNPCVVAGAGVERTPERPIASLPQVRAIAGNLDERYRALVLTAALTGCRWGELAALRRRRLDLLHATLTVRETLLETNEGLRFGPPKTDVGRRAIALPASLVPVLGQHMARFSEPGSDGLVFVGAKGSPLRRTHFRPKWLAACRAAGVEEGLHFHDLRHTANTLAAATGASTKELMARMGHASSRAALLYQHATEDRDAAIARALDEAWTGHLAPVVELHR
jgi:integrase